MNWNLNIEIVYDITLFEGELYFDEDRELPDFVKPFLNDRLTRLVRDEEENIRINFTCSGYYEEAYLGGPPEDCSPAESDEERVIDSILIGEQVFQQGREPFEELVKFFQDDVENYEVDYYEDGGY